MVKDLKDIIDEKVVEIGELTQMFESMGLMRDSGSWSRGDYGAMISYLRKISEVYGVMNAYTRLDDDVYYAAVEKEFKLKVDELQDDITAHISELPQREDDL